MSESEYECFICGAYLSVNEEWRLNPKYETGSESGGEPDEYGHRDCFILVFEQQGVYDE